MDSLTLSVLLLLVDVKGGTCISNRDYNAFRRDMISGQSYRHSSLPPHTTTNTTQSGVSRCELPRETGICRANMPRWYYDKTSDTCKLFTYGGCQGNQNNFPTKKHCQAACIDEVLCPSDPNRTCRVSESTCVNATCPLHPNAVCLLVPCSCRAIFIDRRGLAVQCGEPTTTTDTTTATTTAAPETTTPKFADEGKEGHALRNLTVMVVVLMSFGLVLLVLSIVLRKWRGHRRRTCSTSTTTLINGNSTTSSSSLSMETEVY